ncbi:MAG TPA: hypothetical protein DCR55_05860 [Lentisphaeria bacterium]|nr:hypothetical protein [Lentisphaeria bacterium]
MLLAVMGLLGVELRALQPQSSNKQLLSEPALAPMIDKIDHAIPHIGFNPLALTLPFCSAL